jgi:hypothetical protein
MTTTITTIDSFSPFGHGSFFVDAPISPVLDSVHNCMELEHAHVVQRMFLAIHSCVSIFQ